MSHEWLRVVLWFSLAVNLVLVVLNLRSLRRNRAALDRLVELYAREAERGYEVRRVGAPMTDAELKRRGL